MRSLGGAAAGQVWLAALALVAAAGAVALRLFHHTAAGRRFDLSSGRDAANGAATPHALSLVLETVSVIPVLVVAATLVGVALVRRRFDLVVACGVLLAGSVGTAELLKRRLHSPPGTPALLRASYPSGHATIALALGLALVLLTPPGRRPLAALAAVVYAVAVGGALVVTAWHYPSDVAGGYCVATAWAAAAARLVRGTAAAPLKRLPATAAATLMAAVLVSVAVLSLRPGGAAPAILPAALVAALAATATLAVGCTLALTAVIARRQT